MTGRFKRVLMTKSNHQLYRLILSSLTDKYIIKGYLLVMEDSLYYFVTKGPKLSFSC